jgi:hypothetical protein
MFPSKLKIQLLSNLAYDMSSVGKLILIWADIFSPLLAKPKGTISLPSICLSFRFQFSGLFSAVDEDIQLKFDIWLHLNEL